MSHPASAPLTSPPSTCLTCVSHRTAVLLILAFSNAFTAYQFAAALTPLLQIHGLVSWLVVSATLAAALRPWPRAYLVGVYAYLVLGIAVSVGIMIWVYLIGPEALADILLRDMQVDGQGRALDEGDRLQIKRWIWIHALLSLAIGVVVQTVLAWPSTLIRYAGVLRWEVEAKKNAAALV